MTREEAQDLVEKLDAISRQRALDDNESRLLEQAIRVADGEAAGRLAWGGRRALVRAGLKRNMGLYLRHNRS